MSGADPFACRCDIGQCHPAGQVGHCEMDSPPRSGCTLTLVYIHHGRACFHTSAFHELCVMCDEMYYVPFFFLSAKEQFQFIFLFRFIKFATDRLGGAGETRAKILPGCQYGLVSAATPDLAACRRIRSSRVLAAWQFWQRACRLFMSFVPPSASAITWSRSKGTGKRRLHTGGRNAERDGGGCTFCQWAHCWF